MITSSTSYTTTSSQFRGKNGTTVVGGEGVGQGVQGVGEKVGKIDDVETPKTFSRWWIKIERYYQITPTADFLLMMLHCNGPRFEYCDKGKNCIDLRMENVF